MKKLWKTPLKVRGRQALGEGLPPATPDWGNRCRGCYKSNIYYLTTNIPNDVGILGKLTGLIWQYVH